MGATVRTRRSNLRSNLRSSAVRISWCHIQVDWHTGLLLPCYAHAHTHTHG